MSQQQPDLRKEVVRVKQIEDGIISIARAMKDLSSSKLNDKALLILLQHCTGQSQKTIKKVLDGLKELENTYIKKQ